MRMLSHQDLFAFDAKFHRSCLSHYISERNIIAAVNKSDQTRVTVSAHDEVFKETITCVEDYIIKQEMVSNLKILTCKFIDKLREQIIDDADSFTSWKMKYKLKKYFGNKLSFVKQPGKSDLVCVSTLTIDILLKGAAILETNSLDDMEVDDLPDTRNKVDERHILHVAAGILRDKMTLINDDGKQYMSSHDLSLKECSNFVPTDLYDFMTWCVNKSSYLGVTSCAGGIKDNLKAISLSCSLIAGCQNITTPLSLGLGIRLHHDFGSKAVLDDLNALGYTVSYDEVRRFLTSGALAQKDTVYVPRGFELPKNVDQQRGDIAAVEEIDAAIDNFDQNEDTLDGKSTTHSMAAVLYKRCPPTENHTKMARLSSKSLSSTDADFL